MTSTVRNDVKSVKRTRRKKNDCELDSKLPFSSRGRINKGKKYNFFVTFYTKLATPADRPIRFTNVETAAGGENIL